MHWPAVYSQTIKTCTLRMCTGALFQPVPPSLSLSTLISVWSTKWAEQPCISATISNSTYTHFKYWWSLQMMRHQCLECSWSPLDSHTWVSFKDLLAVTWGFLVKPASPWIQMVIEKPLTADKSSSIMSKPDTDQLFFSSFNWKLLLIRAWIQSKGWIEGEFLFKSCIL